MTPLVNDRWRGEFGSGSSVLDIILIEAWVDAFKSWRQDTQKKVEAGQDVSVELLSGAQLIDHAAARAKGVTSRNCASGRKSGVPTMRDLDEKQESLR